MLRAALVLAASVAVGCATSENGGAPGSRIGPSPEAGTLEAGRGDCASPPGGWEPGVDPPAYCVKEVSGSIQDVAGAGLSAVSVSVCGRACFAATTDALGMFSIPVGAELPNGHYALFVHARPTHASFLLPLPNAPPPRLAFQDPIVVSPFSAASARLPVDGGPASSVAVGPLRFDIPAGTGWQLSAEDGADGEAGRLVRFAKITGPRATEFAANAALVYALAPFEAKADKPLAVRIEETGGLAAGAAVELLAMGGLDLDTPETTGRARRAARGHVSADGTHITTDPGEGITILTWLAVRALKM